MTLTERLDALNRLRKKATPKPWRKGAYSSVVGLPIMAQPDPSKNTVIIAGMRGIKSECEANADFIAAAHEAVDLCNALAARLDKQDMLIAQVRQMSHRGAQDTSGHHCEARKRCMSIRDAIDAAIEQYIIRIEEREK